MGTAWRAPHSTGKAPLCLFGASQEVRGQTDGDQPARGHVADRGGPEPGLPPSSPAVGPE